MAATAKTFHWADYVIFSIVLFFSCAIGLYYAFSGGKQKTQKEFLMADREMSIIPVAVSIMVSFLSAVSILGAPAEVYLYGTQYWMYSFGIILAAILTTLLFVPLLYPLNLTSSYEYLELRFQSKAAKILGSILLITSQIIYIGIATYSPATALEAVTKFPAWASILCMGCVSTFYTTLGGMKAVIWADVFQAIIMVGGLVAIVIVGCIEAGGLTKMWQINEDGGRVEFFNFDTDPTTRQSFWSLVVGGCIIWLARFGVNQVCVQRYSSLPSINKARIAVLINAPGILMLFTLFCLSGMVIYSYFYQCDPLSDPDKDNRVGNANQLIPYFVMKVLGWPGVPGVFVASLFSAALSTISSSVNSMAAVVWEDMLKWKFHNISELKKTVITKCLVIFFGLVGIAMAFAASQMKGTVFQAAVSFTSTALSPVLGLFLLGAIFPWANWVGAVIGGIIGLIFPMWLSIGKYTTKTYNPILDLTTEGCNFTYIDGNVTLKPTSAPEALEGIEKLYTVSFLWIPSIGTAITVVIGLLISVIVAPFIDVPKANEIDRKYLIPIFDWLCCCLPNKWRQPFRCGYDSDEHEKPKTIDYDSSSNNLTKNGWQYDHNPPRYGDPYEVNQREEHTKL